MKRYIPLWLFIASVAIAGGIKTWADGDVLTSSDLNAAFQHIHNNMVGGHGARLVNADVNATAAIAHSKLAVPALIPKAWAVTGLNGGISACDGTSSTACVINASSNVTSIVPANDTRDGEYVVTLTNGGTDTNYAVLLTIIEESTNVVNYTCRVREYVSATQFKIQCDFADAVGGAAGHVNTQLSFVLFDTEDY